MGHIGKPESGSTEERAQYHALAAEFCNHRSAMVTKFFGLAVLSETPAVELAREIAATTQMLHAMVEIARGGK